MSQLTPWQHYQQDLTREDFSHDAAQEKAVKSLQRVYDELMVAAKPISGINKLFAAVGVKSTPAAVKGLWSR
mgnify:FL=1